LSTPAYGSPAIFECHQDSREFDGGSRIEIEFRVHVEIIGFESRLIVLIPVDLGIDDL
jgi:hypothetical protein